MGTDKKKHCEVESAQVLGEWFQARVENPCHGGAEYWGEKIGLAVRAFLFIRVIRVIRGQIVFVFSAFSASLR